MLFVKNRLIFGAIKTVLGTIFKAIYKILSVFNLQPLIFCAVAGALLEIAFQAISGSNAGFIFFHLLLCLCVLYAVLRTIYVLLGFVRRKQKRRERAQILSDFDGNTSPQPQPYREETVGLNAGYAQGGMVQGGGNYAALQPEIKPEKPKYYRVRQNPKYVMAEFADRYELYLETNGSLQYIRTDYKGV